MKDFIYTEKFDKYLKGKLEDSEKLALEEEIRQDPLLRNEVSLQKDIYKALSEERRLVLKSRLDNVHVGTEGWLNLTGIQWAAIISSVLLISAGSFYYYDTFNRDFTLASVDIPALENTKSKTIKQDIPKIPVPEYVDIAPEDSELSAFLDKQAAMEPQTDNVRTISEPVQKTEVIPEIVRPDVLTNFVENDQQINYSDFEAPDKTILEKAENLTADVTIETISDKNYSFHYKLVERKLYLFGDFQGIPYKIIALNREDRKMLFLEYLDRYYSLDQNQTEIAPLTEIKNPSLVRALDSLSQ